MTWRETTPDALPSELLNTGEPTATLNGGSAGTTPILAEKVQDVITALRDDVQDAADAVEQIEQRVLLLDSVSLSGSAGSSGTALTVPAAVRGIFRSYTIRINAGASGGGDQPRPLVCRINGDSSSNYRYNGISFSTGGSGGFGTVEDSVSSSLPRIGYVGAFVSAAAVIEFLPSSLGSTSSVGWTGHGWINRGVTGSNNDLWMAGGRWNPESSQEIETFNIRTSNVNDEWAALSRASLWGHI